MAIELMRRKPNIESLGDTVTFFLFLDCIDLILVLELISCCCESIVVVARIEDTLGEDTVGLGMAIDIEGSGCIGD